MPDVIVLSELELILTSCGLRNNLPQTKNFDYTRLDARSKRILNRLHAHLEKHTLSLEQFLAPVIEHVRVEASNNKSEDLALFNSARFHELLHEHGIRRSDEEYDNLNLFLCLNENTHQDMLMLRKLKVALIDVGRNEYLQSFGLKKRRPDLLEDDSLVQEKDERKKGSGSRYEEPKEEQLIEDEGFEKKSEEGYENEEFEGEAAQEQAP